MKMTDSQSLEFGDQGPAEFISMPGRRVVKLLCNAHHVFCLALVICTFDLAIGIALACYGLTIGLVLLTLRLTHNRNMEFTLCDLEIGMRGQIDVATYQRENAPTSDAGR
jgi:hypothetical protein